ncbi:hypothetical protein KBA39_10465, partial [Myxococcota bacterium]|nr:hypothetical protein [Myxococcota bacterium]
MKNWVIAGSFCFVATLVACGSTPVREDVLYDVADIIGETNQPDIAGTDVLIDTLRDSGDDAIQGDAFDASSDTREVYTQELPPEVCRTGTAWSPEKAEPIFEDVTATSGLSVLGVTGIRAGTVDFDGDGLADLVIRNAEQVRDSFDAGGVRRTWLLRNKGG